MYMSLLGHVLCLYTHSNVNNTIMNHNSAGGANTMGVRPDIAEYTLYIYCVNSVYIYKIACILRICIHYRHVGYIVYILQPI
jgi:hypothetical protein